MDIPTPEGIVSKPSAYAFEETVKQLTDAIQRRGMTLFAVIDHRDAARAVGLEMQEATNLIFGSPKAGTPLMIASPLLALDLPLKALVWRDADGHVWVSYTSPAWLAQRFRLAPDLAAAIAGMEPLIAGAITA